jgi:cellulose synthase/poly-beta-1,6-N-acetylglucosamine synthase-like glycosyltransferase
MSKLVPPPIRNAGIIQQSEMAGKPYAPVAIIVTAYNEEASIAITLTSLLQQSTPPEKIIVVVDFSSDRTGEIARTFPSVTVIRPPENTGSKAGAQNFALPLDNSKYVSAVDADTTLANDAIEKMVNFLESDPEVVAASIIIQEGKDLVISTAKGLFYNAGTSVETVMNVFSEDLSMGRGPAK